MTGYDSDRGMGKGRDLLGEQSAWRGAMSLWFQNLMFESPVWCRRTAHVIHKLDAIYMDNWRPRMQDCLLPQYAHSVYCRQFVTI